MNVSMCAHTHIFTFCSQTCIIQSHIQIKTHVIDLNQLYSKAVYKTLQRIFQKTSFTSMNSPLHITCKNQQFLIYHGWDGCIKNIEQTYITYNTVLVEYDLHCTVSHYDTVIGVHNPSTVLQVDHEARQGHYRVGDNRESMYSPHFVPSFKTTYKCLFYKCSQ